MDDMAASAILEIDSGTWTGSTHPHNGYYAGNFSDVPSPTQSDLDAMISVYRDLASEGMSS
ncbi:hypothetical protein ACGFIF_00460 [Kribbella sp. NPDC049174]|uniref:hypothetical protein n=1 Tax=Kribbella sp. NPDC049174 TaxID=3364112 RepID=UPI00371C2AE3